MSEIFEIVKYIIFWVALGLNITSFVLNNRGFKRWRQKYEEYCELNSLLKEVIEQENKFLLKLKEKDNDNRNNDNSSSSC